MLTLEIVICFLLNLVFFIGLYSSIFERENRATFLSFGGLLANSLFWCVLIRYHENPVGHAFGIAAVGAVCLFATISLIKYFPEDPALILPDSEFAAIEQFDERDNMFARNNLQFHSDIAAQYYERHPERLSIDERIHRKPELGEEGGRYFKPYETAVAEAGFAMLDRTRNVSEGAAGAKKNELDLARLTKTIKRIALRYGAVDVGIASLRGYHFYSHVGRHRENWGERIESKDRSAIVIIVAMELDLVKQAPAAPAMIETARQYVEAAKIAHVIAHYLRSFGCAARSHVDGYYQTLCVPLAAAAGLGEVGRMGILMHPVYGPCLRISAVTTELELPVEPIKRYPHIRRFCVICKKCSDNCPTGAISGDEAESASRGCRHWSINQESCFAFWKESGTDCGFCICVCPFSKPNTLFHKLARFYVSRNPLNQQLALWMDDLFYGRKIKLPKANEPTLF